MLVLAAPDKFKGTADAPTVAAAMASGAEQAGADTDRLPMSDGGDGLLDVFGGGNRTTTVTGPLGHAVPAAWRWDDGTAVIESALASGLVLAGGRDANDPMAATSAGTGELIAAALAAGAHTVIVGVGGSACTDGGLGALEALAGVEVGAQLLVCCDVTTRYEQAAAEFAPQKGADAAQVAELTRRLARARATLRERYGIDVGEVAGAGAAGGLAGGLLARGASLRPGFDVVADRVRLRERIARADLVITGEGRVDRTSLAGKVVGGVARLAHDVATDVVVVAGSSDGAIDLPVVSLVERFGERAAHHDVAACVADAVRELVSARRAE